MSKPGKSLKTLCKKLGVRLTVKRGKKRVYKSVKVLKSQCERKRKVVKRKRRRRKFGTGTPEQGRPDSVETPRTVRGNPNAITPGYRNSPPGWLRNSPGDFPSPGMSPIMLPPSVRSRLGPRTLDFTDSDSDEEDDERLPVRRQLFVDFGKKKKVKRRKKVKNKKKVKRKRRRRKFGKKSKKKSVDIVSFAKKNKIPLGIAATILSSVGIGYYIKNRKPSEEEQLFKEFINIPDSDKLEYLAKQDRKTKEQLKKLHEYRGAVVRVWQNIMNNNNTPEIKEIKDKFLAEAKAEQTSHIKTNKNLSEEEEKAAMDSFLLIKMFPLIEKVVKKYNKNFEEFKKNYF